jgi:hypothetical protein
MLQGCWRLGRDTRGSLNLSGRSEMCDVKEGRIYGTNGGGERSSAAFIRAPAPSPAPSDHGQVRDSTLGTTQPAAPGPARHSGRPAQIVDLPPRQHTLALCRDGLNFSTVRRE